MSDPLSSTLSLTSFSNGRGDDEPSVTSAFASTDPFEEVQDVSQYESLTMPSVLENQDPNAYGEPNHSKSMLRSTVNPFPIRKNTQYLYHPTPYKADLLSAEEIRELNSTVVDKKHPKGERPAQWRESLDFVNHPQTYTGSFMCQFPLQIHNPQLIKFADLTFTLPAGLDTVTDLVRRIDAGNGQLKLSFTPQQLAGVFGKVPNLGRNDWSIVPYTIRIVEMHANLPDDFTIQLSTAKVTKDDRSKGRQHWVRNAGGHNRSEGTGSTASAHSHIVYRNIHRTSLHEQVDLFIADDELYNSGDFHRWLNADEERVWQEVHDCRVHGRHDTLHVACGPDDMIRCHTVLQGLVLTENDELIRLSKQFDHPVPKIVQNEHSQDVHEVSAKAVEHLLNSLFEKIDKHKIMMRLEDLAITLAPLRSQGREGLKDLQKKADAMAKHHLPGRPSDCYYPEFLCKIQIAYTTCDHPPRHKSSISSSGTGHHLSKPKSSGIYSMPTKAFLPGQK